MTLFTIFVLFADDIRILATDQNGDKYFYVFVLICFFFFLIEILLLIIVRPGYICSFFFWMDFISTISIVMEIPWVIEDVLHLGFLSDSTTIAK